MPGDRRRIEGARVAHELIAVLTDTILPMAERLCVERLILPGDAGKASFGPYPPTDDDTEALGKGFDVPSRQIGSYGGHGQILEWVFGFSGKAELALDGRRYELAENDLAVVPPGAAHLERVPGRQQSFHLLWICAYLDRNRLTVHSSSYSGGSRFQFVDGACVEKRGDLCRLMLRGTQEALGRDTGWEGMVRAAAVELVVALIRHVRDHGLGNTPQQFRGNVIEFAKAHIQSHHALPLTLKDIARAVFLSPNYFSSLFTRGAGTTVFDYIQQVRVDEARRLLLETELPVHEVARQVGFRTAAHFTRSFKARAGRSPRDYRQRGSAGT